jgi:glycosyltransferase involved in cell wall biosynthesis
MHLGWNKGATVIYNGIDIAAFPSEVLEIAGASDRFYTLGRLVDWKRQDLFVRAAAIVKTQCPSAEFYIFGEGPMRPHLIRVIDQCGLNSAVHLMGWTDLEDRLVRPCGIFVFPSHEEPFGRALIEAVLQGKVVIASNSGAVPELLPGHELLFERGDITGLARLMVNASRHFDTYRLQAHEIRERFADQFNVDRLAEDYSTLYLQVTEGA